MHLGLRLGASALALTLAACSSIPMGTGGSQQARGLDYLNDDVANLLVALDLPPSLEPAREGSVLTLTITAPSGNKQVAATLVASDAGELAGTLAPPSGERNYYLLGFSEPDQVAIRDAQSWAGTQPAGTATASVAFTPRLCRNEPLDPTRTTLSALVALPGTPRLPPLISNAPLSTVLSGATDLPTCPGHSG
ncbi:MAG: hypothetical protein ACO1OG_09735 [Devosia sp.]